MAVITAIASCKKQNTETVKKERTMFIRVQEVANDGSTTTSPVVTVKVYE